MIEMFLNDYQELAMRTNDGRSTERLWDFMEVVADDNFIKSVDGVRLTDAGGMINACLGLSGEVGELNDLIKKCIFHDKEVSLEHLKKELGDVMWYVAMMCESLGWDLDEICQMNIEKLKKRYPEGFDVIRANNRQEGDV